ncbi:MAG: carbohydrate kinase family protein [Promethearchaeota archaeon]
MEKKLLVIGELHQDLYYESDFYEQLVDAIVSRLLNFIKYNPDDLFNRKLLEKIVKDGFSDTPKKIVGYCFFKRGGNGNNSAEFLANLDVPTKLMSVIGRGSEWMIPELQELGIDTSAIYQIDEITPVSTIIKSTFTTKIHLAPNLKNKMNFESVEIDENIFNDVKLAFSTPIAEKFIKIFEKTYALNFITAFNIETQKIQTLEQLDNLIKYRYDLFFLNLKDAHYILKEKLDVNKVDNFFNKYAKIRIYTAGKDGSHIITDNFQLYFPGVEVSEVIDRTGAGDCYAAGFLSILFDKISSKKELENLLKKENSNKLKQILHECGLYGTYSALYKITKQQPPTKEILKDFMKSFKLE